MKYQVNTAVFWSDGCEFVSKTKPHWGKRHQTDVALQNFNLMLFLLKGELQAKRFSCHVGAEANFSDIQLKKIW